MPTTAKNWHNSFPVNLTKEHVYRNTGEKNIRPNLTYMKFKMYDLFGS